MPNNTVGMSFDDLIKTRSNGGGGRGRGRGRGRGGRAGGWTSRGGALFASSRWESRMPPPRRPLGVNTRSTSSNVAKSFSRAKDLIWQHGLFNESMRAAGLTGIATGTRLYISNLHVGVSNEDIKELFSEVGRLKRSAVHYDRLGRSNGSAEVVFVKRSDALAAMKRYNNVLLDGKPMKIEIIGANVGAPVPISARVNVIGGSNGRGKRTVTMMPVGGVGTAFSRGASRGADSFKRGGRARGRGRGGRGRKLPIEKTADELDKELDNYHADAMQT